ncbi:MAG: prolyl oligopeptidase family serine peptidase [Gammaproteobacteria bacterium]|nr:prolyl oligopeptidase family serine peptidase [Gammaproteobacteria bacterium]
MKDAAYGTWSSPISASSIVAGTIGLSGPCFSPAGVVWSESRPEESGRNLLVLMAENGSKIDLIPPPYSVRSRVHEYGGASWLLADNQLYFVNFSDQQIYQRSLYPFDAAITPLTNADGLRFADFIADTVHDRLIAVMEDHREPGQEAKNYLGSIDLASGDITVLHQGHDFYASPDLSTGRLCWLCWDHPQMPWDGTTLWSAEISRNGDLENVAKVAGASDISIFQPTLGRDSGTFFISDKNGWWNIYYHDKKGSRCLLPMEAEFGLPQWVFGMTRYRVLDEDRLLCIWSKDNIDRLGILEINSGKLNPCDLPFTALSDLALDKTTGMALFVGASPTSFPAIYQLDINTGRYECLADSSSIDFDEGYYAVPETVSFPTGPLHARPSSLAAVIPNEGVSNETDVAHGFYYPPTNKDYTAVAGERPPLLVKLHGGPTSATQSTLNLQIQYWTSRGFGVLDLNYRGSTGYGRVYRQKLNHQWGITDVEDACAGALYLAAAGKADDRRMVIRGGSAGGYTTLAALTFADVFSAGASYYGIGDLILLAEDTHKFESRYLDSMIGPYPEHAQRYIDRSPLHHIDLLNCPVIFFQGSEDKVVPPNQAASMVEALKGKNQPVAYVLFEGEQHGFRQAENIKRALNLEFYFYARIFGYKPADDIEPVSIYNLDD